MAAFASLERGDRKAEKILLLSPGEYGASIFLFVRLSWIEIGVINSTVQLGNNDWKDR